MLDTHIKILLSFHVLTRSKGATAAESLLMKPGGLTGIFTSVKLLYPYRESLSLMSSLMIMCSALLTTSSTESVGINLVGHCDANRQAQGHCAISLSAVELPAKVTEGLLSSMEHRRHRGTLQGGDFQVKELLQFKLLPSRSNNHAMKDTPKELAQILSRKQFASGRRGAKQNDDHDIDLYGVTLVADDNWNNNSTSRKHIKTNNSATAANKEKISKSCRGQSISAEFMNGQTFGASFMFAGFGVVIALFWNYFSYTAMLEPYRHLSRQPQTYATILAPRAGEPLTGLRRSFQRRDLLGGAVSCLTILSKFAPIFLSNIPF
ncbi:hypothetical protein B0H63DRAFT_518346 [Podospora didyma]|uniref:Uncharacterized protein n=1 Tax=Podospora didyma TaxID=330526 RepID=A0AAE0P8Q4_9PEZI|nr:hypothetical protein B0H63DRAFT_518346 [Podospora didyma]